MKKNFQEETMELYIKQYGESSQEVKDLVTLFAISEFINIDKILKNHLDKNQSNEHE